MRYKTLIAGKGLCGRAVLFEELSSDDVDECALEAARAIEEGDPVMKLRQIETYEGILRSLKAVSKRAGLTEKEFLELTDADWVSLTPMMLQSPDSEFSLERIFGRAKDYAVLARLYRAYHIPLESDVESIVGKAVPVSTGD